MIKIGIIGLGRLGKHHALNLHATLGCDLVAACSIVKEELEWAKQNIDRDIACYDDYDAMLYLDIDAVFLVSTTALHAEQVIKGLKAGKHVFCEKPLAIDVESCRQAADTIKGYEEKQVFMLGFVRRFDPAYAFAKKRITEGAIGEPFLVRSQTSDHDDFAEFQVEFTKTAGGIFYDMNVHDIDLVRWYLGAEIKSAYALGGSYVHKAFETIHDADNATVMCECEHGKTGVITASRTAFHGHDTRTEIFGTQGIIRIGYTPAIADVEILDTGGIRRECVHTFYDRFEQAFKKEAQEFIDCIKENRTSTITTFDALQATIAAETFTRSFQEKRVVHTSEI